ncbi:MAG: hypothetical protein LBL81_05315 [Tannerella sp.]|jgi:hypothetical protein|nr:hypothetical protein [Tannerella sp.]
MDQLKAFINANRDAFEEAELPQGHLGRFEEKLRAAGKKKRIRRLWLTGIAAAFAACLAGWLFLQPGGSSFGKPENAGNPIAADMVGLQHYYSMQMADLAEQIQDRSAKVESPWAKGLADASRQVLLANSLFNRSVLPTLPYSDYSLLAMQQQYTNSLESLHFLLRQLDKWNHSPK